MTHGNFRKKSDQSLSKSENEILDFMKESLFSGFLKKSLHDILSFDIIVKQCPGGEIGRRSGLKIHR